MSLNADLILEALIFQVLEKFDSIFDRFWLQNGRRLGGLGSEKLYLRPRGPIQGRVRKLGAVPTRANEVAPVIAALVFGVLGRILEAIFMEFRLVACRAHCEALWGRDERKCTISSEITEWKRHWDIRACLFFDGVCIC